MATSTQINALTALYVGYFDRAPDPAGLQFWIEQIDNGREFNTIAADFAASPEAVALYPYLTTPAVSSPAAFITSIYANLFGRAPDAAGLEFWTGVLNDGSVSVADMIEAIIMGARDDATAGTFDKTVLDNKVEVGLDFASDAANTSGFEFDAAAKSAAVAAVNGVTEDEATVVAAKAGTDAFLTGAANQGNTFTLTAGIDALTGTAGNDTFNGAVDVATAANNTFTVVDSIDGGAGKDNLKVLAVDVAGGGGTLTLANVSNIENFFVRNLDTAGDVLTVDASAVTGEEQIWNDRSTAGVAVTNAADGTVIGVKGNNAVTNSATTAGYEATAKAGSVLFDGMTKGTANVTLTGAALETVSIGSTGGLNTAGTVDAAGAKTVNVNATTGLTVAGITTTAADSTLNVTGAGKATLGTLDTDIDVVDASANTGGVAITLDGETNTKFTGGAGADKVTLGAAALVTGNVDGGAGTDTLVANATNLNSAASGAKYSNFEVLQSTGGTIDLDNISGITAIELNGGNVTDLSAAQAAAVKVVSSGTYTIGVKGASTPAQIDTVALTVDDGAAATNTITLTNPTLTGVEKLSINAVDNVVVNDLQNAISLDAITMTGAGTQSLTTGTVNLAANSTIDASAATGKITVDASAAQGGGASVGLAITGGSAADTLTGTAKADVVTGGAGNDILLGRAGGDTIVGGDGDDVLQGDGVGTSDVTETAVTDFAALTAGQTLTLGGITVTDQGAGATSAEVAAVFASVAAGGTGNSTANLVATGTLTGYSTGAVTGGDNVTFTSTTANTNVADLTAAGTGSVDGITVTDGAAASINDAGDAAGADILTGGAGNDTFRFAAGTSHDTVTDSITDLNLGSNGAAGKVDTLVFENAGGTISIVTLAAGDQANVTAAADLTTAAGLVAGVASSDGATSMFTYGTDSYVFHNVDGNGTFNAADDILVKVTGVTGSLDASDIALV